MRALSVQDLVNVIWRRKLMIIAPALVGLALGYAVFLRIPPKYRAGTVILVESQKISRDYVKTTVTTSIQERLRTIEQQIKNRENMERIITEAGLFPELVGVVPMEDIVRRIRKSLNVRVQGNSVFRIISSGDDPATVARVANRLAEVFIQENLKLRSDEVENTSSFLEGELAETKARLEEEEAKVAEFRISYGNMLPSQRDTNLAGLEQLQVRLRLNLDRVDQVEMRKVLVQSGLDNTGTTPVQTTPGGASRLEELRRELAALKRNFTDRHPDVIRLSQEVAELEVAMAGGQAPAAATRATGATGVNLGAQLDLAEADRNLEQLRIEREGLIRKIAVYQRRLEEIPRVEQELTKLTRDYDNLERSYRSLLAKRLDARLAENLERSQQGERFSILEKAVPPSKPYAPQKQLILAVGAALGLAFGVGLAFLSEQMVQTFRTGDELLQAFPAVRVMASVPRIRVDSGRGGDPDTEGSWQAGGAGA